MTESQTNFELTIPDDARDSLPATVALIETFRRLFNFSILLGTSFADTNFGYTVPQRIKNEMDWQNNLELAEQLLSLIKPSVAELRNCYGLSYTESKQLLHPIGEACWLIQIQEIEPVSKTRIEATMKQALQALMDLFGMIQDIPKPATIEVENPQCTHSPDFRSVNWYGQEYSFTRIQAECIKVLWANWKNKTPDVGDRTVLTSVDSNQERLDHVFRAHFAWSIMIIPGKTKGTHRLNDK